MTPSSARSPEERMRDGSSRLAVVIVSYETRELLNTALCSLRDALPSSASVVVVDNASRDGSADMVVSEHPWAQLVPLPRNAGFAAGVNAGFAATDAPYILVLNPDVTVDRAGIDRLMATLDDNTDAAGASPLLVGPDGRVQSDLYRRVPSSSQVLLFWTALAPIARRIRPLRRRWLEHPLPQEHPAAVDQLPGGAILLRREALETVGPLDEGYFIWFEDVDWCYRARIDGWRLLVAPRVRFTHQGGASFRTWGLDRRALQFYRAGIRFLGKHDLGGALAVAARCVPPSLDLRYHLARWSGHRPTFSRGEARRSLQRLLCEIDRGGLPVLTGPEPSNVRPMSHNSAPSGLRSDADAPEVDVIVINWNGRDYLPRCLEALSASTARTTITVVDNASEDRSVDYVRRSWPGARMLALDTNEGYAGGANAGIREGTARYVFLLNPDLLVAPDHLAILRDRLDADHDIGAAQGKLLRINRDRFMAGQGPGGGAVIDSAGQRIRRTRMAVDRGQGDPDDPVLQGEVSVFSACGAGLFLRREMLRDLAPGGPWLDPTFFAYKEDVDLGWRARLYGWDIRYIPTAVGHHVRAVPGDDREAWRRLPAEARRHSWKNHYLMLLKNDRLTDLLRSLPYVLGWEIARQVYALTREPFLLKAYIDVARLAPAMIRERRRNLSTARKRGVDLRPWFGRDSMPPPGGSAGHGTFHAPGDA